jgi:hypothetical protein
MQNTKTYPGSIFNPEWEISETKWRVSLCKKAHITGEDPEHAFLVIQTHNKLCKREILYDDNRKDKGEPGFAIVKSANRYFIDKESLEEQFREMIWRETTSLSTIANIAHKTWLVDHVKVEGLLLDIEADAKNPPKFSIYGNTSVLKDEEYKSRTSDAKMLGFSSAALSCLFIIRNTLLPNPIVTVDRTALAVQAGWVTASAAMGFMADYQHSRERFKAHNCATWCVEKLNKLGVEAITRDLESKVTDNIAYVTGLHVYTDEDDKAMSTAILTNGVKNRITRPCNELNRS